MKQKIDTLVKSYFYFNRIEKQGIYALLFLLLAIWAIRLSLPIFFPAKPFVVQVKYIQLLDSIEGMTQQQKELHAALSKLAYKERPKPAWKKEGQPSMGKEKEQTKPLEINSADSVELVKLYRIGPTLASRIIAYRDKLGGFLNLNQLTEIFGFDPDILYDLEGKIFVDPKKAKRFNLNAVMYDELKTHPYFKYNLSKAIVNYRNQHGPFHSLADLKQIRIVNDSILEKIGMYGFVE